MAASSVSLSAPYTVFPLSQPLNQIRGKGTTHRKCFSSPVESRKRKRDESLEIAVAVDGESVNIYDVRSTQTISSYALPPTIKFSCPPSSSLFRISNLSSLRRTYGAVSFPKKHIFCWEETISPAPTTDEALKDAVKQFKRDSMHDVVLLQDLTAKKAQRREDGSESGVLAVYADGSIRCFSTDLGLEKWEFIPLSQRSYSAGTKASADTVVYATTTSIATAKKSILKDRPEVILPEVATEDVETPEDIILFTVSRKDDHFEARLFSIPIFTSGKAARELTCLSLPSVYNGSDNQIFSIHFHNGVLLHLSSTELTSYSLNSTTPSVICTLRLPVKSNNIVPSSMLRISPSLVLVATNQDISLYDIKYSSLQARASYNSTSLVDSGNSLSGSSTPSTDESKVTGGVFLTSYIQELDLAIGYSASGVVGIQFSRAAGKGIAEKSRKGGLLIDSLCRGIDGLELPDPNNIDMSHTPWVVIQSKVIPKLLAAHGKTQDSIQRLRKAREREDLDGFEGIFTEYVGIKRENLIKSDVETEAGKEDTFMVNGTSSEETTKELIPTKIDKYSSLGEFIVPKKSTPSPTSDSGVDMEGEVSAEFYYKPLRHDFVSAVLEMIFERVPTEGGGGGAEKLKIHFFPPNVVKYLIESGNFSDISLSAGCGLVECLVEFDPTLRTLEWFLGTVGQVAIDEVVAAVRIIMNHDLVNIEGEDGLALEVIKSEAMRLALIRLDTFPAEIIIKALKRGTTEDDIMAIISILRKELVVGEQDYDEAGIGVGIGDIGIVSDLLTVMLDAVGIGGLVLGNENDKFIQKLHDEVAQAVVALEEAAGLKGILEEMFRHADWRKMAIERKEEEEAKKKEGKMKEIEAAAAIKAEKKRKKKARNETITQDNKQHTPKTTPKNAVPDPVTTPAKPSAAGTTDHPNSHKRRLARASAENQTSTLKRLNEKPKGHQGTQPVSIPAPEIKVSPLLPLGLLPPVVSSARTLDGRGSGGGGRKGEGESLRMGNYSVETMVV